MDGIETSGYAISAQRAQLNYRAQFGGEESHPMRRRHPGHHGHHHRTHCHGEQAPRSCGDDGAEQNLRYQRSENSVLKIRTQEGDVVALRIRVGQSVKMSADSEVESEAGTEVAETTLSANSSTKLSLSVKGDLNDDEMAAIQAVFVQSAALADEFFAGDYAAAFESASSLEIDAQQLAKVSLRLKVRESLTYSGSGLPAVLFGAPTTTDAAPDESSPPAVAAPAATESAPAEVADEPETPVAAPASTPDALETQPEAVAGELEAVAETPPSEEPASPASTSASAFWFSAVIDFVGKLIETFDVPAEAIDANESNQTQKVELDLSLKLRIFSSMLVEISNTAESSGDSSAETLPALVPATIEAVASKTDPGLDAVA